MANKNPPPSLAAIRGLVRQELGQLSDENMVKRGMGYGTPGNGNLAGKLNAVWAEITIVEPGGTYDIPHALGAVPVSCELKFLRVPDTTTNFPAAHSSPVRMGQWTETLCQVHIQRLSAAGSLDGCTAVFLVKGA